MSRIWRAGEWSARLAQLQRLAQATHGVVQIGCVTITPTAGLPYGISDDAPRTVTRLHVQSPSWSGWRDSWRDAYGLARRLDRRSCRPSEVQQ